MEKVVWIKISKRVQKLSGCVSIWYGKVALIPKLPHKKGQTGIAVCTLNVSITCQTLWPFYWPRDICICIRNTYRNSDY